MWKARCCPPQFLQLGLIELIARIGNTSIRAHCATFCSSSSQRLRTSIRYGHMFSEPDRRGNEGAVSSSTFPCSACRSNRSNWARCVISCSALNWARPRCVISRAPQESTQRGRECSSEPQLLLGVLFLTMPGGRRELRGTCAPSSFLRSRGQAE